MEETLNAILQSILFAVITGCLSIAVKYAVSVWNARIDDLQASTKLSGYAHLNKYIDVVQIAIETAVSSVSQTYVDTLKQAGRFDASAQLAAKTSAEAIAKSLITEDAKNAVSVLFGDFEIYLNNRIEEAVTKKKINQPGGKK